jgi:hypothetical protein
MPVICLPSSEQITELGRISESFSHVIADNKCCFMDITFTEKVLYIRCIWYGEKKHSGSVAA